MKCVSLICSECGKEFEKPRNEYNRRIKKGIEKFYCSLSCAVSNSNKVSPHGNLANLKADNRKDEFTTIRWFLRRAKSRKNKKGPTDLTEIYLKQLWEDQNGICPFTGWKLRLPRWTNGWSKEEPFCPSSASLDRIDNTLGYVKGNVRFIAVMANYARNTFSDEEVIKFAKAVTKYNMGK
jgi:hypothetical protein